MFFVIISTELGQSSKFQVLDLTQATEVKFACK